jgi:uncharacterized alpha-E superfamily protein
MNFIHDTLGILCDEQTREVERKAGELHARLHYGRTNDIMEFGLHEYLMEFLEHMSRLTDEVTRVFLVPTYERPAEASGAALRPAITTLSVADRMR